METFLMAGKNFMQRNHVSPDCILAVAVVTQCTDRHGMVAKSVLYVVGLVLIEAAN